MPSPVEKRRQPLIDRESYCPAYVQLAAIITEQIASGKFKPGDRIPSESQLCEAYGLSPLTVRRAIEMLVQQGLLWTRQGKGTFVKAVDLGGAAFRLRELQQFVREGEVAVHVVEAKPVIAPEEVKSRLGTQADDRLLYMERLVMRNGDAFALHREYVVLDAASPSVESELDVHSLDLILFGKPSSNLKWAQLEAKAGLLDDRASRHLGMRAGSHCFVIEHLFYDFLDRPVSWGRLYGPPDLFKLTATVGLR